MAKCRKAIRNIGLLCLFAYVGIEYYNEPFGVEAPGHLIENLFADKQARIMAAEVAFPVIWLLILVIGGLVLPTYGTGLGGIAVWTVLFSRVIVLSQNCRNNWRRHLTNFGSFGIWD